LKILVSFFIIFFIGCGYKPSSVYQKKIIGDKIYTNVQLNIKNPKDSVFLKDAANQAVISTFGGQLASKDDADTQMNLKVNSVSLSAIDYDNNGYPILYRVSASITTTIIDKYEKTHTFNSSGSYEFAIEANSIISDNIKHNAIREALLRALDELAVQISILGMKDENIQPKKN